MKAQIAAVTQRQLKKQTKDVLLVYLFYLFYIISALLFPRMLSLLIGQAAGGGIQNRQDVILSVVVLVFCTTMLFLSNWVRGNAGNQFSYSLRADIWKHNLYASYPQYRKRDTDADFQIITMDSTEMGNYYFQTVPGLLGSGLLMFGSLVGMCHGQDGAGIVLISLLVSLGLWAVLSLLKKMELLERQYVEERGRYFSYLVKVMDEIRTLKLFVLYQRVREQISEMGHSVTQKMLKKSCVEYMQINLLQLLQYVLLTNGLIAYVGGRMPLEDFLLFEQYATILTTQMTTFTMHLNGCKKKKVVEQKLEEMLLPRENYGKKELDAVWEIAVENITFSYNETKEMYRNFSYRFEMGKCYLLKAPNGFGKTTLFELMTGIEKAASGAITYNGVGINEIDMPRIRRKQICFLMQEEFFRGENLQENMDDYLDDVPMEELGIYLEQLHFAVQEKEGDFNKILSGGQKKKLALAIMMKKAQLCEHPVIFMDEPTNMLDQQAIETVVSYVRGMKEKAMIIIISHDAQFDAVADVIVQLDREADCDD